MSLIRHKAFTAFQTQFQSSHGALRDPHVRALAWLLTSPNLLDAHAGRWQGAIAALDDMPGVPRTDAWLKALDADPAALHAVVARQPTGRLGRYAEQLLGFYLRQHGRLFANNVQIRANANQTVGEFDFLLHDPGAAALIHWEFATKFYLLESQRAQPQADCFVGPNLVDTLGAKMGKIMNRQLKLSHHPAAQAYLTLPVSRAEALVKGWLFYHDPAVTLAPAMGVTVDHCRGFWCTRAELAADDGFSGMRYAILPRLHWLAPARLALGATLSPDALLAGLPDLCANDAGPVLIAALTCEGDAAIESSRGFVVPDDWRGRAAQRAQHALVKSVS
jgi:hypothetical protein